MLLYFELPWNQTSQDIDDFIFADQEPVISQK